MQIAAENINLRKEANNKTKRQRVVSYRLKQDCTQEQDLWASI